jgi:hypothetical protein
MVTHGNGATASIIKACVQNEWMLNLFSHLPRICATPGLTKEIRFLNKEIVQCIQESPSDVADS